jgi:hypothetical protein
MSAMLADLVASVADEFTTILADTEPANDDGEQVFDRLWTAGLFDIPDLIALLLRRAEEERIAAAIRSTRPAARSRFLQSMVSDENGDVSAAAMALILARGRRRDRFDGPRLTFDDISAETAVALVNAVAAALRGDLAQRVAAEEADERLSVAAQALLSRHDEGNRLEARLFTLVHALENAGRVDEGLLRSAFDAAEISVVAEILARRSGIGFDSAWEHLTGGGTGLALLLRLANLSRDVAGEVIAGVAQTDAEAAIGAFDQFDEAQVESARTWLRLNPAYRSAIGALETGDGKRSV